MADESDNQNQFDVRVDHRLATRPGLRPPDAFPEDFLPVTPLPDGSGIDDRHARPAGHGAWSFASSYQRVFSSRSLNELRVGDTRRMVERTAAQLSTAGVDALGLPGIPSNARFPNTLPTFVIAGYQQLGSPANTATDFSTSVTRVADTLTWLQGPPHLKVGADLRWERLDVDPAAVTDRVFTFTSLFTDLPGIDQHRHTARELPPRAGADFSIDLQQDQIRNRAHFQEYFVQDDWRLSRSAHRERRAPLHAELPVDRDEQPGGGLQPATAAARLPRARRQPPRGAASCTRTTSVRGSASSTG